MSVGVLVIHDIILLESISKSSGNTPNTFIFAHWEYSQTCLKSGRSNLNLLNILDIINNFTSFQADSQGEMSNDS